MYYALLFLLKIKDKNGMIKQTSEITIKDIAKKAGVSTAAVSYVINNKGGVSKDKAEMIKKIIKETGYKPNLNSQRLATGKSFIVQAAISSKATHACYMFYYEVLINVSELLKKYNYNLTITTFNADGVNEDIINSIKNKSTDGFLFFQDKIEGRLKDELEAAGIPYVVANPGFEDKENNCIIIDFEEIAYKSIKYLIDCGHKDIAMFSMGEQKEFFAMLIKGYKKALKEHGIPLREEYIFDNVTDESSAAAAMQKIAAYAKMPTAIFCSQDIFAVSAMVKARELGIKVPEEVSFIGAEDMNYSKYAYPALTANHIGRKELAQNAVSLLMAVIDKKECSSVTLPVHDIEIRDSVSTIK